jgi:hypothetical protein
LALVFAAMHVYATPVDAARSAAYPGKAAILIVRVNRYGNFATVLMKNAAMEGSVLREPILVERFGIGWQAIDLVRSSCELQSRGIDVVGQTALMRGMPQGRKIEDFACREPPSHDAGPSADIERIRQQERGPLVDQVVVVDRWALSVWSGAGGGQHLYQKIDGRWAFVAGGGGPIPISTMRAHKVPESISCKLKVAGATCR